MPNLREKVQLLQDALGSSSAPDGIDSPEKERVWRRLVLETLDQAASDYAKTFGEERGLHWIKPAGRQTLDQAPPPDFGPSPRYFAIGSDGYTKKNMGRRPIARSFPTASCVGL